MAHPPSACPSTYLFVPANRPERFARALEAVAPVAGAVIIDLEDAVAPDIKHLAGTGLQHWLAQYQAVPGPLFIRINAAGSEWFEDDLRLLAHPAVHGVMLPKAEDSEVIARLADTGKPLIALIETGLGVARARELARQPGVLRLAFGAIDLQVDLGIDGDDQELHAFRSELVLASRLAALAAPIDGVTTAIDQVELLQAESQRARRFGFGAKLCIHPRQVAPVAAVFAPTAQDIAWAERVRAASDASGGAAVAVDGKMVDKPVLLQAMRILAQAGQA